MPEVIHATTMNCNMVKSIILCLLFATGLSAQNTEPDTVLNLKDVTIAALRQKDFSNGMIIQHFDSIQRKSYQLASLAELLGGESGMFIKSYGIGNIATATMRGSNATQTTVLWNGFSINNPMLGQTDLSLVPITFIDNISIESGGGSALWGSGAVGGVVHLNSSSQFDKGWSLKAGTALGSFGFNQQNAQVSFSNTKWITSLKFFKEHAENDFFFHNHSIADNPLQRQKHAGTQAISLMNENIYRVNDKNKISMAVWWQNNNRKVPPTVMQQKSEAIQTDKTLRLTAQWTHTNMFSSYALRSAWFTDIINYEDDLSNISSNSHVQSWITEAEGKWYVGKHRIISAGINNRLNIAEADNFSKKINENKLALFITESASFFKGKLRPLVAARQEFATTGYHPFTWTAGMEYVLIPKVILKANVSSVFRQPTLNDKYWVPGGNPDLKPEKGRTADAGIEFRQSNQNQRMQWRISATLFDRQMTNQIIWLPADNFWKPQNLQQVWSRGVESNSSACIRIQSFKLIGQLTTAYTLATNQKKLSDNDASYHKQLIYVPMYNANASFAIQYRQFLLRYSYQYTGYRYTSSDSKEYLTPYHLHSLYISYSIPIKKVSIDLFLRINNLFDEDYYVMQNKPMPLRYFRTGMNINFNNK